MKTLKEKIEWINNGIRTDIYFKPYAIECFTIMEFFLKNYLIKNYHVLSLELQKEIDSDIKKTKKKLGEYTFGQVATLYVKLLKYQNNRNIFQTNFINLQTMVFLRNEQVHIKTIEDHEITKEDVESIFTCLKLIMRATLCKFPETDIDPRPPVNEKNPFSIRTRIEEPSEFVGRKYQLMKVCSSLKNKESISVYGDQRIGKSSFLYYLYKTGNEGLRDESFKMVYVDLQSVDAKSVGGLFRLIFKELDIDYQEQETVYLNLKKFDEIIKIILNKGIKLVVLLDEFESLFLLPDEFSLMFFEDMRSRMQKKQFMFVTSSRRKIRDLFDKNNLKSQFWNYLDPVFLKNFNDDEFKEFIYRDRGIERFSNEEVAFINSCNHSRHPLILQILCCWIVKNRTQKKSSYKLKSAIKDDVDNFFLNDIDLF